MTRRSMREVHEGARAGSLQYNRRENQWGASTRRSASRLGVSTHEENEEWRVAGFPQYNRRVNEGSIGGT